MRRPLEFEYADPDRVYPTALIFHGERYQITDLDQQLLESLFVQGRFSMNYPTPRYVFKFETVLTPPERGSH
ncbi:hypothetical protein N806_29815 [Rhodococcus sp. P27]|nr:hypothetical protein N806_29815 [Rhodococcus sp. P27]